MWRPTTVRTFNDNDNQNGPRENVPPVEQSETHFEIKYLLIDLVAQIKQMHKLFVS